MMDRANAKGKERRCIAIISMMLGLSLTIAHTVWAQYPDKPITMYVGFAPGASADISSRALSEVAGRFLGQPVVGVNKPGGGSAVRLGILEDAKPDGYTVGILVGVAVIAQHITKTSYDIKADFTPIISYGD